jgi:hypothetical protein
MVPFSKRKNETWYPRNDDPLQIALSLVCLFKSCEKHLDGSRATNPGQCLNNVSVEAPANEILVFEFSSERLNCSQIASIPQRHDDAPLHVFAIFDSKAFDKGCNKWLHGSRIADLA